jgi:hypothetical protein
VTPELDLTSNWSRNALAAYARGVFNRYWGSADQDTNDLSVGANGRLDVRRTTTVNMGVDLSRLTEPRTSPTSQGAPFPIQYKHLSTNLLGEKEFNRLRLSGRFDWERFRYLDRPGNFPHDDQDRDVMMVTGRADYALSPDTAFFVEAAGNRHAYRLTSSPLVGGRPVFPDFVNRNSSGLRLLAGANFEFTALMRGELGVGYLDQHYQDDRFGHVTGPGVRARVEWFPTQLITVTATGTRSVEDAAIPGAAALLTEQATLRADYELLRNLILTGAASFGQDDYRGLSRRDQRVTALFGGTFLLNRHVGVRLDYSFYKQDSTGTDPTVAGANFRVNKITATLTAQY